MTGKDSRRWSSSATSARRRADPFDRILATRFGAAAIRVLAEAATASRGQPGAKITRVHVGDGRQDPHRPQEPRMIQTARLGIAFGDEEELDLTPEAPGLARPHAPR